MQPRLTCFGGVGEIGGNKLLLEDKDVKVLFDFGSSFSEELDYFAGQISPRSVNGAGDLFEFGLLPEIPGLYGEDSLQNTDLKYTEPEVDAIVLSHYHWDHMSRIEYVDPKIPIYCGETTSLIHQATSEGGKSPLKGHEIRTFRTGGKLSFGSVGVEPVHVDHSIPGAYGFIVHHSAGTLAYTGDYRFHGPAGSMTDDFISKASSEGTDLLVTEGTRVKREGKLNTSEEAVLAEATRAIANQRGLVFSTFRGNDVDRINTFEKVAELSGRRLVVSMKTANLLNKLKEDKKLKVPVVGKDVGVYVRRKKSGRLDDSDYQKWERQFLNDGVSAQDIHKQQDNTLLHLEVWYFPELIDIKPDPGGTYIHAATEAYNEEGEKEEAVIKNWTNHVGFAYRQLHASGHAPLEEVRRLVRSIGPKLVVPVHTEHPRLFARLAAKGELKLPSVGVPIELS